MTDEMLNDCSVMAYARSSKAREWADRYSPYEAEKARLAMDSKYVSELGNKYKDNAEVSRYVKVLVMLKEGK